MNRRRLLFVFIAVICAFAASAASAFACTDSWTGTAGDGLWSAAGNWSNGVPQGSDDVCLPDIGHSYTVTLQPAGGSGGGTINSLTVGTTGGSHTQTLDIVGQSYVYQGQTQNGEGLGLANGGNDTINATGSVMLDATNGGGTALPSDTKGGPAALGDSPFANGAVLKNYGSIVAESSDYPTWDEQLNANVLNEAGGTITVQSGSLNQMTGNTMTNDGTVTTDAGGDYNVSSGGTVDVFVNNGTVANNGTFEVGGQTGTFTENGPVTGNAVSIQASSTLADQSGTGAFTLEFYTPVLTGTIPAGQTVTVRGASDVYQGQTQNGTTLSLGAGTVTNNGTLILDATSDGTKALQSDVTGGPVTLASGTLTNNGTLTWQTDDAAFTNVVEATVGNAAAGTASVSGSLKQDTGVSVTNAGTFTLAPGSVYALLQAGSFTNAATGTLVPQIASATSFGSFAVQSRCCNGQGSVVAGGTLAPALIGGFTPTSGEEFDLIALQGGAFVGTYPTITNSFVGDYAHETTTPAFVGIVYKPTGGGGGGGGGTAGTLTVGRVGGGTERFTVPLSCSGGGLACSTATVTGTTVRITRKTKRSKARRATITVASGRATLAAGASRTLTLRLNASGRALLKPGATIRVTVTITSAGKTIKTVTVKVHRPKPKSKGKGKGKSKGRRKHPRLFRVRSVVWRDATVTGVGDDR